MREGHFLFSQDPSYTERCSCSSFLDVHALTIVLLLRVYEAIRLCTFSPSLQIPPVTRNVGCFSMWCLRRL
ncbi:Hypothetical protein FKW44_002543 [Caligus rogercresseyi]|uniref:Uncharacterized protein n=1 Tax=Caligus rogercresseyi TaxID=217165 RepID=A0A7T8KKC1_CALRO|nr:Hypothetical protein FKW44_002543 [Caligus rogercresseyi]